ncbi:hypothetical protein IFM89_002227 [Coptis chinensis]|uniref:Uncharacterized protein n=1 Tax=Coptis chinensis TaxID=261450 RepID=A0A835M6T5_9MAGN|nr:hypothetical protein IFM89_002227 [Coptis chinensis]
MDSQLDNLKSFPPLTAAREQGCNPSLGNNQMQHNNVNATGNQASNWSSLFQGGNASTSDTSLQRFELDMIEGVTQVSMDLRWKGLNVWKEVHTTEITSVISTTSGEENTVHNAAPVTTSNNEINREDRGAQTVEGATGGTMNVINLGIGGLNVVGWI